MQRGGLTKNVFPAFSLSFQMRGNTGAQCKYSGISIGEQQIQSAGSCGATDAQENVSLQPEGDIHSQHMCQSIVTAYPLHQTLARKKVLMTEQPCCGFRLHHAIAAVIPCPSPFGQFCCPAMNVVAREKLVGTLPGETGPRLAGNLVAADGEGDSSGVRQRQLRISDEPRYSGEIVCRGNMNFPKFSAKQSGCCCRIPRLAELARAKANVNGVFHAGSSKKIGGIHPTGEKGTAAGDIEALPVLRENLRQRLVELPCPLSLGDIFLRQEYWLEPALNPASSVAKNQTMSRKELLYAPVQSTLPRRISELHITLKGFGINLLHKAWRIDDVGQIRGAEKLPLRRHMVIKAAKPKGIPGTEQFLTRCVPEDESKGAVQSGKHVPPPAAPTFQEDAPFNLVTAALGTDRKLRTELLPIAQITLIHNYFHRIPPKTDLQPSARMI